MIQEIDIANLKINSKINVRKSNINDDIELLINDIKNNGLINPLTVIKNGNSYDVCAGQRRLTALKEIGFKKIPCLVINKNQEEAHLISLSENIHRNKLNNSDKINIFSDLMKKYSDIDKVATITNYSKNRVKDYLYLKEHLNNSLIKKLDATGDEKLSIDLALFLSKNVEKENQEEIYNKIILLGNSEIKKQLIINLKDSDKTIENEQNILNKEDKEIKEENEEKIKIPKKPWVYDNENNPVLIPKELYVDVYNLIQNK